MSKDIEIQPSIHEQQVNKLHKAVQVADRVTVEFGTGNLPLFASQNVTIFDQDNLYIGVNIDPKQHKRLADRIDNLHGFAILNEDIDTLPLPDGTIDTIFMGNVFGEPDSKYIMADFRYPDGYYRGNSNMESKVKTLHEAGRLLKPDGHLVILENTTPYRMSKGVMQRPSSDMTTILKNGGYKVVEAVDRRDDEWIELVSQFAEPAEWWSYASYLVVAKR